MEGRGEGDEIGASSSTRISALVRPFSLPKLTVYLSLALRSKSVWVCTLSMSLSISRPLLTISRCVLCVVSSRMCVVEFLPLQDW